METIYTGVIAAPKKDNYTWPADWEGYEWQPAIKDRVNYLTARSTDEYMTDAVKAQFDRVFDNDMDYQAWIATPIYVLNPANNTVVAHDGGDISGYQQGVLLIPVT